jgi:hypothetical protein
MLLSSLDAVGRSERNDRSARSNLDTIEHRKRNSLYDIRGKSVS